MVNLDDNSRCVAIVRCTGTGRRMLETAGGRCEDVEGREPQAKYLEFIAMAEHHSGSAINYRNITTIYNNGGGGRAGNPVLRSEARSSSFRDLSRFIARYK